MPVVTAGIFLCLIFFRKAVKLKILQLVTGGFLKPNIN